MILREATKYPPVEERLNELSHGIGFILSIIGTFLLWQKVSSYHNSTFTISFMIYGCSMMLLYVASTLYHASDGIKKPTFRNRLNILDHAAIYILIAGTYTPFCVITLAGKTGNMLLAAVWLFALAGVILKLFFTGKFDRLSTLMYIFMGWMVVFAIKPLIAHLTIEGLYWLLAGGISYTLGAVFYSLDGKLKFNHAIFHVFVLIGTICHFAAVYFWVLPPL